MNRARLGPLRVSERNGRVVACAAPVANPGTGEALAVHSGPAHSEFGC